MMQWICDDCGRYYGSREDSKAVCSQVATWHQGVCGVCKEVKAVTEPRDYGLSPDFMEVEND